MVRSGPCEVQVCVAGVPVPEHVAPNGAVYVETVRLAHAAPRARPRPRRNEGSICGAPGADAPRRQRFDTPATYMQEVVEHDPYGERFTQRWPVTPYTLHVTNRSVEHVQAVVYIDGAKASRQFINPGATGEIKGFKDRSSKCEARASGCRSRRGAVRRSDMQQQVCAVP